MIEESWTRIARIGSFDKFYNTLEKRQYNQYTSTVKHESTKRSQSGPIV